MRSLTKRVAMFFCLNSLDGLAGFRSHPRLMRYYLFCLLLRCAVIPGESGPIPAEIAGRYRDDVTDFSYFSVGTDGTYTNAVYLCSRGNSREVGTATFTNNIVHL